MKKNKMITVEQRALGVYDWDDEQQARIERNLFAHNGETWEALRFCKNRNGRHNRVHLVIAESDFVELFRSAVQNGVFHEDTLQQLRDIVENRTDSFDEVIGIAATGNLSSNIDEELYGEKRA
jgi:hypothetical protein